jgi:sec-independent protein translocase protein TatA
MNLSILLGMIGPWQIILIVLVILLIFGGKKIPEMFRGVGEGIKEFKKATTDNVDDKDKDKKSVIDNTETPKEEKKVE